jgi:hypothetical protein
MILKTLLESYNRNTSEWRSNEDLTKVVQINSPNYLLATVEYLKQKGLVYLQGFLGTRFYIRLSPIGFQSLQDPTIDSVVAMASAYKILFTLENRIREFISELSSKYGPGWWNNCISDGIKKKVNQMRSDEQSLGWQVTSINDITEYLLFDHLGKIISMNWKDVFEPFFKDQQKITHRLVELEAIRNSIAHTRTLSIDGMTRLELYSQDLFNMINTSS